MKKGFDAVAMKRHGSEEVYKTVSGMTPEEEAAFWCEKTEELRRFQASCLEEHDLRMAA
jgi:hypothetical protein